MLFRSNQLFGAVRTEGLAPHALRDDIFRMEAERRIGETIYVPDAIVVDVPKPTAEQLNAYFEANKNRFQIPEFRAFSYVMMTADDVASQVGVTPDMVKQVKAGDTIHLTADRVNGQITITSIKKP